MRVTVNKGETK